MDPIAQVVDSHLDAYCNPDVQARLAAVRRIWNPDGRLVDPPLAATGHEGISEQASKLLAHYPAHLFERTTAVDTHNGFGRYAWKLRDPAGQTVLEGVDFVTLDDHGRIRQIVGFFGREPSAA